jgi:putative ABC transport system substrate-binding protein
MSKVSTLMTGAAFGVAFVVSAHAADVKSVDIITMNDTPQLLEVKDGLMAGLTAHGYSEGKNLKVNFKSAQGNFGTAQQIVRQFIGENPDVIVTITTPTSQAAVAATKEVPIIFTTVTDPLKSKLVTQEKHPGGNASGISDLVPTERQLDIVKEIVPNLKTLGLVYDPSLDNSRSTVESVKAAAPKMGIKLVESPAMGINNVPSAGQALVGKVDAIFVPNDTTVYGAFESLVRLRRMARCRSSPPSGAAFSAAPSRRSVSISRTWASARPTWWTRFSRAPSRETWTSST